MFSPSAKPTFLALLLLCLPIGACVSASDAPSVALEGDQAGECRDGADNDLNGYFDCQDKGCWGSPDCSEGSASSGSGAGPASGGGSSSSAGGSGGMNPPTEAVAAHLTSVDLLYTISFDLSAIGDSLCNPTDPPDSKICDCQAQYIGNGVQQLAEGTRVTFYGEWKLLSTNCGDAFLKPIWVDSSGNANHSFFFDADMTSLEDWVVHQDAESFEPIMTSPASHGQFWYTELNETWDDSTKSVQHDEQETQYLDIIETTVTHHVAFSFSSEN